MSNPSTLSSVPAIPVAAPSSKTVVPRRSKRGTGATIVGSLVVALAGVPGGCVGGSAGPTDAWSTKSQSATTPVDVEAPRGAPVRAAAPSSMAPGPAPTIVVIAEGDRAQALAILEAASVHPLPLVRANAIEALAPDSRALRAAVQRGLVDGNRGVRFVSAMSVGFNRLEDLTLLVEPLLHDESKSVQAAAIFALARCGRPVDPTPLAAMMLSDDPEVRGNAALVLGELGNRSALPVLANSLGRGMELVNPARVRIVELQVAEAQVRLGDTRGADPIRAALFAPSEQLELTALACQLCGRLGDERAATSLRRLVEAEGPDTRPPEVQLAAVAALAKIGASASDFLPSVEGLAISDRPDVRALAAYALGAMSDPRAVPTLRRLMSDRDPLVQTAAAGALLRLMTPR